MLPVLWALIPTSVKWLGLSVLIGIIGFGAWKWEHSAKLKAQAKAATMQQGMTIAYEAFVKLYQEREKIAAKAAQERRKLNELQQSHDLDGLSELLNNPDGVRRNLPANPQGGPATSTGGKIPGAAIPAYQDSEGHLYR